MQTFIILTAGRTGSSAIAEELNSHPHIVCHGELARPKALAQAKRDPTGLYARFGHDYVRRGAHDKALPLHVFADAEDRPVTRAEFAAWLDYLAQDAAEAKAVGFKAITGHLFAIPGSLAVLRRRGVKVIWLGRRNVLRQVISAMVAARTGVFNDAQGPAAPRSYVLPAQVLAAKTAGKQHGAVAHPARLQAKGVDFTSVYYEDFVADRAAFMNEIAGFLGVAPGETRPSRLKRMTPEPLTQLLANYDEIAAALAEVGLEHMLAEPAQPT